jgi:Zn-dependent protease
MSSPVLRVPFPAASARPAPAQSGVGAAADAKPAWSWKLAEVGGIGIYVHASFALLLAWVAMRHFGSGGGMAAAATGFAFIVAVFAIIVMHELGHAFAARAFGIRTRSITLLPIGGVAALERMPEKPSQELIVALAGPAVNVVLAVGLAVVMVALGQVPELSRLDVVTTPVLQKLLLINVSLALFNLLPAFPMDGGRALRALLGFKYSRVRATEIAVAVGHAFALFFGFVGLAYSPMLALVAVFVWMGASQELSMVRVQSMLGGVPVVRATITEFRTLAPSDPLGVAVEHIVAGTQHDFPVALGDQVVGVLTRADVVRGLSTLGAATPVGASMHRTFETARPGEMLDAVMPRLSSGDPAPVMVVEGGSLVGMLTAENLAELLSMLEASRAPTRAV